jgi:hypothetical protein
MKFLAFLSVAVLLLVSGCDELEQITTLVDQPETELTTYIIPAGEHSCNHSKYKKVNASSFKFKALFDSSAVYATKSKKNQTDINKLYGISDCGTSHQANSARFGWVWNNNRLEIWAYIYADGQRQFHFVDSVTLNKFYQYEIAFTDSSYIFKVNNTVELPRSCKSAADGYKLYPYFGGDEAAPHKVTIVIEDVK